MISFSSGCPFSFFNRRLLRLYSAFGIRLLATPWELGARMYITPTPVNLIP